MALAPDPDPPDAAAVAQCRQDLLLLIDRLTPTQQCSLRTMLRGLLALWPDVPASLLTPPGGPR